MPKLRKLAITLCLLLAASNAPGGRPDVVSAAADEAAVASCTQPGYRAIMNFPVVFGDAPNDLLTGDFNGDDLPDLAAFGANSGVLLGDGTGKFGGGFIALPLTLTLGVIGDFNDDGVPDLAGTGPQDNAYQTGLLVGDGTGKFIKSDSVALAAQPRAVAGGDFNGDGRLDLAVASYLTKTVVVYPGDGAGHFGQAVTTSLAQNPSFITAGDFNGDGRLDLAASSEAAGSIAILLNGGGGRFTALDPLPVASGPYELAAGDFNRDGRLDLAVVNNNPRQLLIYRNDGAGRFMQTASFDATFYARVITTDLNRDGALDLVMIKEGGLFLLLNDGSAAFTRSTVEGLPNYLRAAAVEDFNLDGVPDLAFSNGGDAGGKVFIALGEGVGRFLSVATFFVNAPSHFTSGAAIGDFNSDGNLDVAIVHYPFGGPNNAGGVTIMLGDGMGGLRQITRVDLGRAPRRVLTQDFNGDGKLDLAVTLQGESKVVLLTGDGTGFFGISGSYDTGRAPLALVAGDFNGDGKLDLVANGQLDNVVTVLLGNGTGFAAPQNYPAGESPLWLAAGDFNGDSKLDLAVSSSGLTKVTLLYGDGAGRFGAGMSFTAGVEIGPLAAADFNVDGKLDLAVADEHPNRVAGTVTIFAGDGAGNFAAAGSYNIDDRPIGLTTADINGDARPDLVVTNQFATGATVLLNAGAGLFGAKISYFSISSPSTISVGDLNKDGRPDFVITTVNSSLSVVLSACLTTTELASASAASYRTAKLATESIVAAFGQGLATTTAVASTLPLPTTLAGASVSISDSAGATRPAPLFFVSPGQINYQVPLGTAEGLATIAIKNGDNTIAAGRAQIARVAPGLFTANSSGRGLAAAIALRVKADGTQVYEPVARLDATKNDFVPVPIDLGNPDDQVFLLLFGTGLRRYGALARVTARVGGETTEVLFVGPQAEFVGLDQVNLRLPPVLSGRGESEIVVTVEGKTANIVRVAFK